MAQHEDKLENLLALKHILVADSNKRKNSLKNLVHDTLAFGRGTGFLGVLSLWILGEKKSPEHYWMDTD